MAKTDSIQSFNGRLVLRGSAGRPAPVRTTTTNKYKAIRTEIDGHMFDSRKEGERYLVLRDMVRCGEIRNLEIHPEFEIRVNGQKICTYEGDFQYTDTATNEKVLEDVKSEFTRTLAVFRLKKKLMRAVFGIEIREVR